MKRKLTYPELWQQKRNELPVNGDPKADWLQMHALLDKQMPVTGIIKKPFRFKLPKWGLNMLTVVSATAAVYFAGQQLFSKNHYNQARPVMQQAHHDSLPPKDSLAIQITRTPAAQTDAGATIPSKAVPLSTDQTKPYQNTAPAKQPVMDSTERPAVLNLAIRHDSLATSGEAASGKPGSDSAGLVQVKRVHLRNDTTGVIPKPPKKKKRKLSVFF